MAVGSAKLQSYEFVVASITLAKTFIPLRCKSSTAFIKLFTLHTAMFSNAPADVKISSSFNDPTPLSGIMIACTPKQ